MGVKSSVNMKVSHWTALAPLRLFNIAMTKAFAFTFASHWGSQMGGFCLIMDDPNVVHTTKY